MAKTGHLFYSLFIFTIFLTSCTGTMRGMVRQDGQKVDFAFRDSTTGHLEHFTREQGDTFK